MKTKNRKSIDLSQFRELTKEEQKKIAGGNAPDVAITIAAAATWRATGGKAK